MATAWNRSRSPTPKPCGLRLLRVQDPDHLAPLDPERHADEGAALQPERLLLQEAGLGADVGHQQGLAGLGHQPGDPLPQAQGLPQGAVLGEAEGRLDHQALAALVQQHQRVGVHVQGAPDEVQGQAEQLLHVERGGERLAEVQEGVQLRDALPEGAILRLELAAAVLEELDLLQRADLPGLALDLRLQVLDALPKGLLIQPLSLAALSPLHACHPNRVLRSVSQDTR